MAPHVCPWWGGYFIDNRLRRWLHHPEDILAPYLQSEMKVLDFGCGMGFFSIAMARLVGDRGMIIAVDLQQRMLDVLAQRAARAGVADRIRTHRCESDALRFCEPVDFALAFYSAHEVPDLRRLLRELAACVRPGARLLVVEPVGHVTRRAFRDMLEAASEEGFECEGRPRIRLSHSALLVRS